MRIVVPIKQVPETGDVRIDEKTGTVIRQGVSSIVNPLDLYAIESALRLKEQYGAETIALSMGPPAAKEALKEAMAMGIDRGILLTDRAFAGSDTWATSRILAAAFEKIGDYDLVICGERATDGDTGQVGPELAAYLGLPVIAYVESIGELKDGVLEVIREVEDGAEHLGMRLPGLLTVLKAVGEPRLPTLDGKIKARQTDIEVYSLADFNLDKSEIGLEGSPTRVVKIFRPNVTRQCRMFAAGDEKVLAASVNETVIFLAEKEVI